MDDEGVLFEGLRLGSVRAFESVLRVEGATMRRVARLYVPDGRVDLLRRAWAVALPGLDMFTWHTTLRAWLTGILVTYGRARGGGRVGGSPLRDGCGLLAGRLGAGSGTWGRSTGQPSWRTLAWSAAWDEWGWDEAVSNRLAGHRPRSAPVEAHPGLRRQLLSWRRRRGVGAWRRLRWDLEAARTRRPGT